MAEFWAAAATALWTGVLTSVSPCPLATNIAALTYISRHSGSGRLAVPLYGALYALGRALAYVVIGFLLVKGLLSAPSFSFFMQKYGNQALSPLLVLAGMYMLGLIGGGFGGFSFVDLSRFKARGGAAASLAMGLLFALAFCPVSAALYFGVVIPLAAGGASPFWVPLLYGLGTALPVLAIAAALDLGVRKASGLTALAGRFDSYARPLTGWVFVAAGLYLGLKYIFGII
ncbi:MAG TPA: aromatic aminobenezylarsenical efflux permease ArsG family transporter [Elusimicrobiales bacterium]|nr:aromatic aminobenezylarsenical efflux permease ArsG family transporter [Elusimicrobiales bacterium]